MITSSLTLGFILAHELGTYSNIRGSFIYKLFVYCLVTLCVIYAHRFLPAKRLQIVPTDGVRAEVYGDDAHHSSSASWVDQKNLRWQCDVKNDGKAHLCGFYIFLDEKGFPKGRDLSGYDRVNIDLSYEGNAKLVRFFTRSFLEGFSSINDDNTARFSNALIPKQFISDSLSIDFSEFFVAEWWLNDYQVPRQYMSTDFKNIRTFGLDLGYPTPPGLHVFHLKKMEFVGLWVSKEHWHLGILIFWITAIFIGGGYNLWQLNRRRQAEKLRLDSLISQNSMLETETNHYKQLSMLDQLTGLLNRHGLTHYIDKNFSEEKRQQVALVIIDIDYFKKINDTHGHNGGDIILQKIAHVLRDNIRATDYAARWGGEEFLIVMPATSLIDAHAVAEELRVQVENAQFEELPGLKVTISLGVGAINGVEPFHMLFRRVDVALYQAKAQGRNRVILAEST